jgi:transaldolase
MLWASTGVKDPKAPADLYVTALAAAETIDTMPEKTLLAFAEHGAVRGSLPRDGGDSARTLQDFERAGINVANLAAQLQVEGAQSFVKSWTELLQRIAEKSAALATP